MQQDCVLSQAVFVADAHRGDKHRFVARADEKLTFSGTRISCACGKFA
jgi:hypothetical protein